MSSIEFADGKPLTREEVRQAAANELRANYFYRDDELRTNWEGAYGYYKGDLPDATDATNSTAVSTDVSDTIEWILPAIIKPLIESPDVVRFDPVSPEDQDQADTESDYVHHTFMKRCNGFVKLYVHIKDALMLKNAVFATYWDEGVRNQKESYRGLTEVELADLLSPAAPEKVILLSQAAREEPMLDPMTGQPIPAKPAGVDPQTGQIVPAQSAPMVTLHDAEVRRFTPNGRPVVENCEPEAFHVRMTHNSIELQDAKYCSYTVLKNRAELQAMHPKYADAINDLARGTRRYWDNEVRWSREDVEREQNSLDGDRNETGDPSQDLIDVHRVYLMLDADGDGYEERYMVLLAGTNGEVMLDYYEVPENPFSSSTPFIAGHKFYGYSLYDKLKKLTDHKTKLLRLLEDNLDLANNPRKKVLTGLANLDDVLISQVGGIWRMDQPDAVTEVATPAIAQPAYALLEYWDKIRAERTGVDPNAQSVSKIMPEESMNHAMERVLSMKEELVGLMIRVFAETGVKDMFLKLRGLMMRHMPRQELVQLRNKWVTINPGNWVERTNTTVVIGLGTGDRIKKTNGLLSVFQIQQQLQALGMMGPLVSPERLSYTVSELIRVQGLGDPDDFVLSPQLAEEFQSLPPEAWSPRAHEAARAYQLAQQQQQQALQQEQMQAQAAAQSQQALLDLQREVAAIQAQSKTQVEQIKAQQQSLDRQAEILKFMQEERRKWAELAAKEDTEETKVAAKLATDLISEGVGLEKEKQSAVNGGNSDG